MTDLITALLLITFLPMIITSFTVVAIGYRTGYGTVGKILACGFGILVISSFFGLMFNLQRDEVYQIITGFTRVTGWSAIALGFILWFIEIDKSLP